MNYVIIKNDVPRVSTKIIAEGLEVKHRAVLELLDKYENRFRELGTFPVETEKTKGRPARIAWLNEEQTIFICSLMKNSERVLDFKQQLSKDFVSMRNKLIQIKNRQSDSDWIEDRKRGKITRKQETDIIQKFVEYATEQGSKSACNYYMNISRMENKALFIIEQKFKNVRNMLDGQQLAVISTCDQIVAKALRDGMAEDMFYKEIYQKAKKSVEQFVDVIGKSLVPTTEEKTVHKIGG